MLFFKICPLVSRYTNNTGQQSTYYVIDLQHWKLWKLVRFWLVEEHVYVGCGSRATTEPHQALILIIITLILNVFDPYQCLMLNFCYQKSIYLYFYVLPRR